MHRNLIPHDQIIPTIPDWAAIERLIARLDLATGVPPDRLAYRFDPTLRGRRQTLFENKPQGGLLMPAPLFHPETGSRLAGPYAVISLMPRQGPVAGHTLLLVSLACLSLSRHSCPPATPAETRQSLGLEMAA